MATLDDAILIAAQAHRGQKDKAGAPYILHPLRLMLRVQSDDERMAAVLHDVIEDASYTLADLQQAGFPANVLAAVECLTRKDEESYEGFVERVRLNTQARALTGQQLLTDDIWTKVPDAIAHVWQRAMPSARQSKFWISEFSACEVIPGATHSKR